MEEKQNTSLKRIYPDLNIEKWSIWQPANSRKSLQAKELERSINLPNGNRITTKVTVGFTHLGCLTTEDQKVYYALIRIWEEDGRPEVLCFSLRRLAKVLGRPWCGKTAKALSQSLLRLQATPFSWVNSYYDSTKKEAFKHLKAFHILIDLEIAETEVNGHITKQASCCKFHDLIDQNIRNNHTKPILFDTIVSFESGVAQMLYKHIDLMMADKLHWERRTKLAFEDLSLEGKDYGKPSVRKRILEKVCQEINGCPISTGMIKISIRKTEDGKDYKIVVDKTPNRPKLTSAEKNKARASGKAALQKPDTTKDQIAVQAETLVKYFYRLFHNLDKADPSAKEIKQATGLISCYGFEVAKNIVGFSHKAAKKTNYDPQTFGGILQYAPKAIAELERKQKEQQKLQTQTETQRDKEEEECAQLETHLKTISKEQYNAIYETAKLRLLNELPWLKDMQESATFRLALYREMVYELEQKEKE
jgi:hypothetical protein